MLRRVRMFVPAMALTITCVLFVVGAAAAAAPCRVVAQTPAVSGGKVVGVGRVRCPTRQRYAKVYVELQAFFNNRWHPITAQEMFPDLRAWKRLTVRTVPLTCASNPHPFQYRTQNTLRLPHQKKKTKTSAVATLNC